MIKLLPQKSIVSYAFAFVSIWATIANFSIYSSEKSGVIVYLLFIALSIFGQIKDRFINIRYRKYAIILFLSFLFVYIISYGFNGRPMSNADFLMLYFLLLFVLTKDNYKRESFDIFIKVLTLLLFSGLIEYFSFVLFQKYINFGIVDRDNTSQSFIHGAFCLFRIGLNGFRFQGLAEEPGLLGTLCGFLIYFVPINKKYLISSVVIWISGFLTFSFAFYVLAIIKLCRKLTNIKFLIIVLVSSFVFYSIFQEYFDDFVVERFDKFEYGDNRSSESLDVAFVKMFEDGSALLGKGKDAHQLLNMEKGVAGAKVWIYQYGVLGFVLIFTAYGFFYIGMLKKMNYISITPWLFFIAFWISFYQRQYIEYPYNVLVYFTSPLLLKVKEDNNIC